MAQTSQRGGPVRSRVRARMMARAGLTVPAGLERVTTTIGGHQRTYSLARAAEPRAVLLALHGAGGTGDGMAALTGFATRAPAAGFTVAFPDGRSGVWNDSRDGARLKRRQGVDDVAFIGALAELLSAQPHGPIPVFATGISNGALMSEHVARNASVRLAGIGLVAGAATVVSRTHTPVPLRPTTVVLFHGTEDGLVPYAGGPIGLLGRVVARRVRTGGGAQGRGMAVPAETVAADWATANGLVGEPTVTRIDAPAGDLGADRLAWSAPGHPPVVLHRIVGGGHTWPGGAQYLPERLVGPVARGIDASGIILDTFAAAIAG